ncbi:MAG: pitrilysin family protein [Planctomycetota bacterium]|nr:pitrilysin family protein [Planctomycetota bacterium]
MIRSIRRLAALCLGTMLFGAAAGADIVSHPDELVFAPLEFTPPEALDYRSELPGGVAVYLAPSHELPLIDVTFTFRGGRYLEPPARPGLGEALGRMIRRGGTTTVSAADLDERFDFLAAEIRSFVGREQSRASMNCLSRNFDDAFDLFLDMVRHPGFDADRLRVYQGEAIEEMKQRNDRPMTVAVLHLRELVYGTEHYAGRHPTQASVESITPEDLAALHRRIFHPGNLIVSVSGDFDKEEMLARLAAALEDWPAGEPVDDPPAPTKTIRSRLYHAEAAREDLPQGTMVMVCRTVPRDHPDMMPLQIMEYILGGGGFSSRITNRVRTQEGLAYAAGSFLQPQVHYPGLLGVYFVTKNETVALATRLVFEEIDRIRTEPVSAEELALARSAFIERLPRRFASPARMLEIFVNDELTGRDEVYWQAYEDRVRSVTAADVRRIARRYLDPEGMVAVVVGPWAGIEAGDLEGRARMSGFFGGEVTHLPPRDPLTLEPIEEE